MPERNSEEDVWLAGTWLKPAALSLVFLSTGAGVIHRHRDLESMLAAGLCVAVTWHIWRIWVRHRRTPRTPHQSD